MATVNAISVALFNAAAGGYSSQIYKDPNAVANAVGMILEKDISTDALFVDHLLTNFGVLTSMSIYSEAKRALDNLVYTSGRGQATTIAIDFLKMNEGTANDYGIVALNFAIKVNTATQYSAAYPNERDLSKLVAVITGVDTDLMAINNALSAINPSFAANLTSALAAADAKAAADKAAEIAALKAVNDAAAKNAADKAAADLKTANDKAIADAAATKVVTDKALADATAALKAANDKAAEAAIKATADKAAAVATVDKSTDNTVAITAYLKAAAAISGVTGTDSMTDSQLLAAIKASDNQVVAGSVDRAIDNPQAITTYLRTTATSLGVSGTSSMVDADLINAIKTVNDSAIAATQKATDDAALTAAVAAQKATDDTAAAALKVITDAAAVKAAADLKAATDQIATIQNVTGSTNSLSTNNDTVMGISNGNDTVSATYYTYGSDDVIVDTSTTDTDVLTLSTVEDITAVPVIVGFENINVNVSSVFAGAVGVTGLAFNADNIRNGTINFDATNAASVVTDLAVTNAANLMRVTSTSKYTSVNINGDASANLTYSGLPTTLVMESTSGSLVNVTATVTKTTAGTISTDATGTVTVTTSADTNVTASTASTVNVTSSGQATVSANTADTVIVQSTEEALVTANAAELVTIFAGDGIDTTSSSAINSTLTSTNTNNITVSVRGQSAATVLDLNAAPNVNQVNVSGTQNVTLKVGLDDIDGLGTSTGTTADDNLFTVVNTTTAGTVDISIATSGGLADFSAAAVSNIQLDTALATGDILTVASNASVVSAIDQTNDLDIQAKDTSSSSNTVRISIKDNGAAEVTGDLTLGLKLSNFATATLTNNDTNYYAGIGPVLASGTTLTIASGVQGFVASSSINLGAGTLRVTGVAPVTLGSAVTANDVAASDATGAITLGLVGVGTVGTVVTGSGNDDITLSTAARTSGDYSISTGSGADSLTISFVEGFSWNGGLGYDTLKMNSTFDLTGQTVSLTSVDAISLDTGNDGTESLTITAAQFNTNTTFTLLGGGSSADNLIVKGSDDADTINASAVSVEVGEAYLTLNGNSGADIITGSEFADRIDGGPGADVMSGGNLQDIYYFDSSDVVSGESIFEASTGTGNDTVSVVTSTDFSTMTAASFDEIEIITLAASQTATFTGAQLTGEAISLTAQSATTESILVSIGSGETFISGLTDGTNVNAIYYTGTSGDEVITGGALNETITGNSGNDVLTGGGGNDTFVFSTSSSNGIDSIYFGVVDGNTVDDILDFTANDAFLGTSTVSRGIFAETDVTNASTGIANDVAYQNVLFLTGDYFADAATLAAATTVFAAVGAGKVLIVYAGTSSDHARIAVCTLDAAGDVTSATDVAILVGVTALEASNGLTSSKFILD